MNSTWSCRALTQGSEFNQFHSHSYYDIPIFDSGSRYVVGYRNTFVERPVQADDSVEIGVIDSERDTPQWQAIGESKAWSWQQGPMAQFIPGTKQIVWNDRESGVLGARVFDLVTGQRKRFQRPVYAVAPDGHTTFSLDFNRLDTLRPGYGYAGEGRASELDPRPKEDGVWRQDLRTGKSDLVLSVHDAARAWTKNKGLGFSLQSLMRRYQFWFNHIKVSPEGTRFTAKLRYRPRDLSEEWTDALGVSVTANVDGSDLRFLADATSHVIWLDESSLYLWRTDGVYLYRDEKKGGVPIKQFAPEHLQHNVHIRRLGTTGERYVFDTPYRETIELFELDEASQSVTPIATFTGHQPERGPFRCDLHPCPSPDGMKIVVTSMQDGGRQMYLLSRC